MPDPHVEETPAYREEDYDHQEEFLREMDEKYPLGSLDPTEVSGFVEKTEIPDEI